MITKSTREHPGPDAADLLTLLPPIFYAMRAGPPAPALQELARPLGPRHFPALMLIAAQQPLTVGELAGRLHFSLATTSQLVADLDRAGLASRRQDPGDRRRTLVEVSQQNADAVHQWYASRAEPLQRALDRLTGPERQILFKSLTVMGEELARSAPPPGHRRAGEPGGGAGHPG
jgi:DNA-binding MarR family transcriptional regulator